MNKLLPDAETSLSSAPAKVSSTTRAPFSALTLRPLLEVISNKKNLRLTEPVESMSPEAVRQTLHELRAHQIELETQNTELRRTLAELDASRARYFDFYDLAPVGYCTVSHEGLILQANLTAAKLLGKARGELVKQPLAQFISSEDQASYHLLRAQLAALPTAGSGQSAETQSCELRMTRSDQTQLWVHLAAIAAQDADGTPVIRLVLGDVSERKRAEQEKAAVEAQLRQSQKLDAIGQLAGGIAHDFNNLITAILGNADMLQEYRHFSAQQQEMLQQISQAGNRASALTRQLLLFSRRGEPVRHDLDLNQVVAEMLKMLRRILGENINLQLNFAPKPQYVHADSSMLDQVLLNLAVNARDAMPEGGKLSIGTESVTFKADHATASLTEWHGTKQRQGYARRLSNLPVSDPALPSESRARPGDFTCLTVVDEGMGMAPELMAHIFEPFFTTKQAGRGTGLGLATVYGIVQQHLGWIEVESRPGTGTTFRVYLPRVTSVLGAANPIVVAQPDLAGRGELLMIVEDETSVRTILRILLERAGYRVLECASGAAALVLWAKHRADIKLLVTDMVMPGAFGGVQLAQKLLKERPDLKVIITSGYSSTLSKDRNKFDVEIAFIPKPFEQKNVLSVVRAQLDSLPSA